MNPSQIAELAEDARVCVFEILEMEPEIDSMDAGRAASEAERAVLAVLREIYL